MAWRVHLAAPSCRGSHFHLAGMVCQLERETPARVPMNAADPAPGKEGRRMFTRS